MAQHDRADKGTKITMVMTFIESFGVKITMPKRYQMRNIFFVVLGFFILVDSSCFAGELPLTMVPVMAATSSPLKQISKLAGDWYFTVHFSTPDIDEFRFYKNTINLNDPVYCFIDGDQFLNNFSILYEDKVIGEYVKNLRFYTVVSLWGPPEYDLGSAYVFMSTDKNTSNVDCHYFVDGHGNVQNYYVGFGGTVPCEPLTKRKRMGSKMKKSGVNATRQLHNRTMWEQHLENLRRNKLQKNKATATYSQASRIQFLIKTALEKINK